jgi:hypothetical protein
MVRITIIVSFMVRVRVKVMVRVRIRVMVRAMVIFTSTIQVHTLVIG